MNNYNQIKSKLSQRILSLFAVFGVLYFGLVILVLSLLDREFNSVTEAASDYGVGHFAIEMNVGFFVAGLGFAAFALTYSRQRSQRRSKVGSLLLFIAGLILIVDSYFTTDVGGGPATLHGIIHAFGGLLFFTTAPIGILLISRKVSRIQFFITLCAFVAGFVILGAPINAGGLAERIILLIIFSSVIFRSLGIFKESSSKKDREEHLGQNPMI